MQRRQRQYEDPDLAMQMGCNALVTQRRECNSPCENTDLGEFIRRRMINGLQNTKNDSSGIPRRRKPGDRGGLCAIRVERLERMHTEMRSRLSIQGAPLSEQESEKTL